MRILHLVESLERGGLERVVVNLARAQRAAGHEVAVICLFRGGALLAELIAAGIGVECAEKKAGIDLGAVRRVRSELRRLRTAVLHTHNAVANYYGALAATGLSVRLINTRHGMGFEGKPGRKERLYRLSLLRTAVVATVCNAALGHYVRSGIVPRRQARVVRNGIEVNDFAVAQGALRAAARRTLGLPDDAFVVGTVGRLSWAKNHQLLIDSFALLLAIRPESMLVIVGDGELRESLAGKIHGLKQGNRVVMTGDRDDVHALLPAFDVFAMTSTTEGYSMALLEAAACGLPAVATNVGGNAEIVQHGITGLVLTDPGPQAFAKALADLATDLSLRAGMGAAARSWIEQEGSVISMSRAYERLYVRELAEPAAEAMAV